MLVLYFFIRKNWKWSTSQGLFLSWVLSPWVPTDSSFVGTHGRTQREKSGPWEGELVDEEVARQSLEVFGSAWHWGISCNRQAVTKDLTSSSKFSGSCVLTLQTLPSESKVRTRPWTWIPFGFSLVSNAGHPLNRWQWKKRPALGNQRLGTQRRINKFPEQISFSNFNSNFYVQNITT